MMQRKVWPPIGIAGILLLLLVALFVPSLKYPPLTNEQLDKMGLDVKNHAKERIDAKNARENQRDELRKTLLQVCFPLAGAMTLALVTLWGIQSNRETALLQHRREQFRLANDQLGSDNPAVRNRGLYLLEQISNESTRDRTMIANIVTDLVHQWSPWPPKEPGQPPEGSGQPPADTPPYDLVFFSEIPHLDVQTAMNLLCKKPSLANSRPDLSRTDLRKMDLFGADLRGAKLEFANLQMASLHYANFCGARLESADLRQAMANSETKWPKGFNYIDKGVVMQDD
jgi:hypothetical protein